jgi:hypothetical protein
MIEKHEESLSQLDVRVNVEIDASAAPFSGNFSASLLPQ